MGAPVEPSIEEYLRERLRVKGIWRHGHYADFSTGSPASIQPCLPSG